MSVPFRLLAFAALLLTAFGVAAAAGGAFDPNRTDAASAPAGHHGERGTAGSAHSGHASEGHGAERASAALPGLAVAQDGLRLVLDTAPAAPSRRARLTFRILGADGAPVRDFDVEHTKRMHLIVVRRDLGRFEHLHPTMAADGTWTADVDVSRAGTYRVFADFSVAGTKRTLGADVPIAGAFTPTALPAPAAVARTATGLEVRLRRDGDVADFDVLRAGRNVNAELEDYLGAKGHLVTLRTGDLAYLHTHPDGERLAFALALPSAGTYRLWVQFQLDGVVHTAAFTQEASS